MTGDDDLELLVLFGSAVTDRRGPESDVDIAVMATRAADLDALHT
jgi:predicted nucleotidyltransferase